MDRNINEDVSYNIKETSLSARRAWIEIPIDVLAVSALPVALRKESVDRNNVRNTTSPRPGVALRKESVDRNSFYAQNRHLAKVALRKESVDRNPVAVGSLSILGGRSPQGERG